MKPSWDTCPHCGDRPSGARLIVGQSVNCEACGRTVVVSEVDADYCDRVGMAVARYRYRRFPRMMHTPPALARRRAEINRGAEAILKAGGPFVLMSRSEAKSIAAADYDEKGK